MYNSRGWIFERLDMEEEIWILGKDEAVGDGRETDGKLEMGADLFSPLLRPWLMEEEKREERGSMGLVVSWVFI